MEGQNNRILNQTNVCSFLVILFHLVGLTGFLLPELTPLFLKLVPYHLLFMLILLVIVQPDKSPPFLIALSILFISGFILEWAGVHTGLIFGRYTYGPTLGFKIDDIPVIIGVNWAILVLSVSAFLNNFSIRSVITRALAGASLLVLLDILIEPVAIKFAYWHWHETMVPLQNYAAWFVFSFLLLLCTHRFSFPKHNLAASVLFICQMLFFAALNLWAL